MFFPFFTMNIVPCASQNADGIMLWADLCVFSRFGVGLSRAIHSADSRLDSGVKWWSDVSSIIPYRRINSGLIRLNSFKHSSKSSICCCFWSIVSLRWTHFAQSFRIPKYSFKMCPKGSFKVSDISINFNLRWSKIILWTFSSVTAFLGRPLSASSSCTQIASFELYLFQKFKRYDSVMLIIQLTSV